jgi:hypothetical protein
LATSERTVGRPFLPGGGIGERMHSTKAIVAFVALACCVAGGTAVPTAAQPQQGDGVQTPNATMVFTDQTTNGTTVQLNSVNLSQGGFVAIHNASLTTENDTVGSVIGVSERLSPGPHQDVQVRLYSLDGRDFNQSRLRTNGSLTAMVHFDSNENNQFDFVRTNGSVDGPYVEGTQAVVDSAEMSISRSDIVITDPGIRVLNPLVLVVGALVLIALLVVGFVVARRR